MLQRDYIMRLLQQFFEALEKLVEERDKKDGPELQLQLQSIYRAYFNHPSTFYYDQDAEYILNEMGLWWRGIAHAHRHVIRTALSGCFVERVRRTKIFVKKIAIPVELFRYT